uniref:Uncharacterized protein n=1 Tax=Vespula pensylvanica TaxID=30213 RepID=A0A834KUZ7_VESPE|nr:hypothetical protein H0235_013183 [Vespula pensylvanica]
MREGKFSRRERARKFGAKIVSDPFYERVGDTETESRSSSTKSSTRRFSMAFCPSLVAPSLLATNTPSAGRSPRTTIRVNVAKSCRRLPPISYLPPLVLVSSAFQAPRVAFAMLAYDEIRTKSITLAYVLSYSDHAREEYLL